MHFLKVCFIKIKLIAPVRISADVYIDISFIFIQQSF